MNDKKRKRSGISIDRASRIQERLVSRASDIFRTAITLKYTRESIDERVAELYQDKDFDLAPQFVQGHIEGYIRAKQEDVRLPVDDNMLLTRTVAIPGGKGERQYISHENIGAAILHAAETGEGVSGILQNGIDAQKESHARQYPTTEENGTEQAYDYLYSGVMFDK